MASSFAVRFAWETWALYGLGVCVVVLRLIARIRRLTLTGLQIDDALMVLAVVWYTVLCISLNAVASGGGSNLMTPDDIAAMTPETHAERVQGSKWVFVSEHAMILTIWILKFCMLIIYRRITDGLSQSRLVTCVEIYALLSFVGTELALFFSCRPLALYFTVPTPNYQCSSYQHYEIAQGVFSISSNVLILVVAMPILIAVRLPKRQKIITLSLFGLGLFEIIAAVLTKVYCLVPSLIGYEYMNWYFREATIAILVTNIPLTWSLIRDLFPSFKRWINECSQEYQAESWPYNTSSARRSCLSRDLALQTVTDTRTTTSTSMERMVHPFRLSQAIDKDMGKGRKGMILVQNDVILEVETAKENRHDYPVWDWTGNKDHVSTTHITGGGCIGIRK
ncbi:Class E vacuolar protein-sorting machinery protein [Venturia nashicola]|uniref:Class E vacuolar protein-sorting machinery protein n=1 Tax=Venturia nashicola TaxID=86259 RepID=A0A4Z1P0S7_9PEZI|nr:Class E vacuolar protein-sorting machinery protein [Venturia nashicola]